MTEYLYRSTSPGDSGYLQPEYQDRFHVVISNPGPRGGKRPPLMDAFVRAEGYDEAVQYVEQEFLARTKTVVTCQP